MTGVMKLLVLVLWIGLVIEGEGGATGPMGLPGQQGATGATGPSGVDGATGATGDQGDQGVEGPDGSAGQKGPVGPPGDQGVKGPAGANGNAGTPGTPGDAGAQGTQGVLGQKGSQGLPGVDGTPGTAGTPGTQGAKGPTGQQGDQGTQGATGEHGTNGLDGDTGATGPVGGTGPTGDVGTNGAQGTQGPQGPIGPVGETGDPGVEPTVTDECADDPTLCSDPSGAAICVNLKYGYICSCIHGDQYGFSWDDQNNTCVRPDDGKTSACDFGKAGCADVCVPGATFVEYHCECGDGFELSNNKHTCQDVDECAGDAHGCVEDCINTYGGYDCTCPEGYMLEGQSTCNNIDECEIDNGGCKQVCTDLEPGYNCSCRAGFVLASDQETCLNEKAVGVRLKLDSEFTADLADATSPAYQALCTDITSQIADCLVDYECPCTFSNGSIIVLVELLSSSPAVLSPEEQEQLVWKVKYALVQNGTTITVGGQAINVDGPVVALFDAATTNESLTLADPCDRYAELEFCLEESRCEVQGGEPVCVCTPSFSGERCNLPGAGYSTENEFSTLEIVQLSLLVLALLLAFLSLFLGAYAFAVYHQRTNKQRDYRRSQYSDSEVAGPPYGKYFNNQQRSAPRPFEVALPNNRVPDTYRRFPRNY